MGLVKTAEEIELMRKAGRLTGEVLEYLARHIRAGVTTGELDKMAYRFITERGGKPSFLGFRGYPASICASIDAVVVHGIPSESARLLEGMIIGIDVGVVLNGYQGDAARTFPVGNISAEKAKLIKVTRECFFEGLKAVKAGNKIGDYSENVQRHAEKNGFSVVRALEGHGIGREMHEPPSVPNYGRRGNGPAIVNGMALALEPMINAGTCEVEFLSDGWTCVTRDRKPSAHYENTVIVTEKGAEILTLID